jgi:hypothetical protein
MDVVARIYAEEKVRIFPCDPATKRPLVRDWPAAASCDVEVVAGWWRRHPFALIGLPLVGLRIVVLDGDRHKEGVDGVADLEVLLREHGVSADLWSETAGGGVHVPLALPEGAEVGNRSPWMDLGIDVRGPGTSGTRGGYIIAPGSRNTAGREWRAAGPRVAGLGAREAIRAFARAVATTAWSPIPEALLARITMRHRDPVVSGRLVEGDFALLADEDAGADGFAHGREGEIGRDVVAKHVAAFRVVAGPQAYNSNFNTLCFHLGAVVRLRRVTPAAAHRIALDALAAAGAGGDAHHESIVDRVLRDGISHADDEKGGGRTLETMWGVPVVGGGVAASPVPVPVAVPAPMTNPFLPIAAPVVAEPGLPAVVAAVKSAADLTQADIEACEEANAVKYQEHTSLVGDPFVVAWQADCLDDAQNAVLESLIAVGVVKRQSGRLVGLGYAEGRTRIVDLESAAGRQFLIQAAGRWIQHVRTRRVEAGVGHGQWMPIALAGHHGLEVWDFLPEAARKPGARWVMLNCGVRVKRGRPRDYTKAGALTVAQPGVAAEIVDLALTFQPGPVMGNWRPDPDDDWRVVQLLRDVAPLARRPKYRRYPDDDAGLTREKEDAALASGTGVLVVVVARLPEPDAEIRGFLTKMHLAPGSGGTGVDFKDTLTAPTIGQGGRVIARRGFDVMSGYWIEPEPGMDFDPAATPVWTWEEQQAAVAWIMSFFDDVAFQDSRSRWTVLFVLLAAVSRPMWKRSPGWLIGASTQGTGKSFLAELSIRMTTKHQPPGVGGWSRATESEMEKWIVGILLEGHRTIIIDNVIGQIPEDGFFSLLLTRDEATSRLMGESTSTSFDTTGLQLILTGNNVTFAGRDWPRRLVFTNLEMPAGAGADVVDYTSLANPFDGEAVAAAEAAARFGARTAREGALLARVDRDRPRIVYALLKLLQAHWAALAAGWVPPRPPFQSYAEISVIRDAIMRWGGDDVFTAEEALIVAASPQVDDDEELKQALVEVFGFGGGWTVKDVFSGEATAFGAPPPGVGPHGGVAETPRAALMRIITEQAGRIEPRRWLGSWLRRARDQHTAAGVVRSGKKLIEGVIRWRIDPH